VKLLLGERKGLASHPGWLNPEKLLQIRDTAMSVYSTQIIYRWLLTRHIFGKEKRQKSLYARQDLEGLNTTYLV
jgi:hypothetical protein